MKSLSRVVAETLLCLEPRSHHCHVVSHTGSTGCAPTARVNRGRRHFNGEHGVSKSAPDRPGVPQRPESTGADDIATESTAIPYRTIGVAAVAIVAVVFVFSTFVPRRHHVLMCIPHMS